jgi:hypothetical protein
MMMNVQRYLWLMAVALMGMLAGCLGGSGSSGFDITEDVAIQEALDEQACQDFDGLLICPAESGITIAPSATPTPTFTPLPPTPTDVTPPVMDTPTLPNGTPAEHTTTPTATERAVATQTPVPATTPPPMQVETNVDASSDITCRGGGSACTFTFVFVATGFPPDAIYRTAFREGPDQPWTLSQPTEAADSQPDQASFVDNVQLEPASNAPSGSEPTVQFAVLVFLSDPGELPSSVTSLSDTGANFAYVLPPVPVS